MRMLAACGFDSGEAVARRYLDAGAKCVLVDVKPAAELEKRFAAYGSDRVAAVQGDVTRRDDIERIVATAVERFGRIDILLDRKSVV